MMNKFKFTLSPLETVCATLLGGLLVHFAFGEPWFNSYVFALLGAGLFWFLDSVFHLVKHGVSLIRQIRQARKAYAKFTMTVGSRADRKDLLESEDKYEV